MTFNFNVDGITPQSPSSGGSGSLSTNYEDLEFPTAGTVLTAPANGYYYAQTATSSANGYILINRLKDDESGSVCFIKDQQYSNGLLLSVLMEVPAGGKIQLNYSNIKTSGNIFRFIYKQ